MSELIRDNALDGELLDAVQNCGGGYNECTNADVKLVEDPYQADVNNDPGQLRWLCDECHYQLTMDI